MNGPDPESPDRAAVRSLTFADGAREVLPLAIGVMPYAAVVGVLMRDAGLAVSEAMLFSVLVYAGASQLTAIELMAAQTPVAIVLLAMLVVNTRFALYSMAVWQLMATQPSHRRMVGAYLLTDQSFVVTAGHRERHRSSLWSFYLGAASLVWLAWQVSTLAGAMLGDVVPAWMPMGLALPLVMMSIVVSHARSRPALVTAITAGIVAVVARGMPVGTGLLLAIIVGLTLGLVTERFQANRGMASGTGSAS
ncbi:MAG: AzlC family ABC transporter permease [Nitriliruptoraceae bacterium]